MKASLRYLHRVWKTRLRNDRAEIAFLRATLHPGDVALDIGANKGAYLYWMRQAVGPQGRVYAFEPQAPLADYLGNTVRARKWRNVTVEHKGMAAAAGELELFVPGGRDGTSPEATLVPRRPEIRQATTSAMVPVVTLDGYVEQAGIPRVHFIKCDVEGGELDVFRGGARVLERDSPVLLFECEQRHLPTIAVADVLDYLVALGYRGRFFGPEGLTDIDRFDVDRHQAHRGRPAHSGGDYVTNFAFDVP